MSYSWKVNDDHEGVFDYTDDAGDDATRIELAAGEGGFTARLIRAHDDKVSGKPSWDFRESFMSLMDANPNPPFSEARMVVDAAGTIWPVLQEAYKEELARPLSDF